MKIAFGMFCLVYLHNLIMDEFVCIAGEQITVLSAILWTGILSENIALSTRTE